MAQLFLERMPGRQIFVSLLVLPTVISPIVAGATWRLLFDNRYGPINQILGWFAGEPVAALWTVNPNLVYPAIILCEIWQWTPFMFLILLAALSNVDRSLTEAAEIDGAGLLAHLPQDRAAGDLACHGYRHPDPQPRSRAHLRHHLGADPGRPRHHDRDDLDLCLCPGLQSVRDQLHRGRSPSWSSSC